MSIDALVVQKIGCAVEFNKDNPDYFLIPNSESLRPENAITMVALVYPTDATGTPDLIRRGIGFELQLTGLKYLSTCINTGSWNCKNTAPYVAKLNAWNYCCGMYNSNIGKIKTIINFSAVEANIPKAKINNDTSYIGIGRNPQVDKYRFDGYMAVVLMYAEELSDSQLKSILYNYPNIPTKGLVLWLDARTYDESAGKWYDLSGKGNHATAYGSPAKVSLKRAEVIVK